MRAPPLAPAPRSGSCGAIASGAAPEIGTGEPSIHTVLRPSLLRTNPVTAWRAMRATGVCGSPRRSRSSAARSSRVKKSVPKSSSAAAAGSAVHAASTAAAIALARTIHPLLAQRHPLERAVRLDARLQRVGRGDLDSPQRTAVDGEESLRRARECVDEADDVALVERARPELDAAREHVDRLEDPPAGERERALRRDLVVER